MFIFLQSFFFPLFLKLIIASYLSSSWTLSSAVLNVLLSPFSDFFILVFGPFGPRFFFLPFGSVLQFQFLCSDSHLFIYSHLLFKHILFYSLRHVIVALKFLLNSISGPTLSKLLMTIFS